MYSDEGSQRSSARKHKGSAELEKAEAGSRQKGRLPEIEIDSDAGGRVRRRPVCLCPRHWLAVSDVDGAAERYAASDGSAESGNI